MWTSGARIEGTCCSSILVTDWKEARDGSGGWLATGCSNGTLGISWVSYQARSGEELQDSQGEGLAAQEEKEGGLYKSHFLLRGHIGEVQLVRWMLSEMRLLSYDSRGCIIVWTNRANVLAHELQINTAVSITDIQWSPCGYYLVACARSGHIMSYSTVTGMTLFSVQIEATSSSLSKKARLTSCSWNQPGTRIAFGTSHGEVIAVSPADSGNTVTTMTINQGVPVQRVHWHGPVLQCQNENSPSYPSQKLSTYLRNGDCVFFQTPGRTERVCSNTGIVDGTAAWNLDQSLLVVIGYTKRSNSIVCFINTQGDIVFTVSKDLPFLPKSQFHKLNVLWALQDSTVILSCGSHIYTLKVNQSLPSLQSLCRHAIMSKIASDGEDVRIDLLPLPTQEISRLTKMKEPLMTVSQNYYDIGRADIVARLYEPVPPNHRLHCILETSDGGYLLKLEHFNECTPLLQSREKPGKRASVQTSYIIEPAFDCSHSQVNENDKDWAESLSLGGVETPAARSRPSFLRRVWSAFKPVHGVMDATQSSPAATARNTHEKTVLAEVEGNSISNRFRFQTSSPQFRNGFLGSVNINTNYIKWRPRKVSVVLPKAGDAGTEVEDLMLVSKQPEWNAVFQIYELDFGGRAIRDSIRNFQIEHNDQVALQFGKVDTKQYCLDFQAPFSPIQALCIALSSILRTI